MKVQKDAKRAKTQITPYITPNNIILLNISLSASFLPFGVFGSEGSFAKFFLSLAAFNWPKSMAVAMFFFQNSHFRARGDVQVVGWLDRKKSVMDIFKSS